MIAIHTKYLNPTNSRGARIKAYTAGWGDSADGRGYSFCFECSKVETA